MTLLSMGMEIFAAVLNVILLFACLSEQRFQPKFDRYLIVLYESNIAMLTSDSFTWYLEGTEDSAELLKILFAISYMFCMISIVIYSYYLFSYFEKCKPINSIKTNVVWGVAAIGIVFWFAAIPTDLVYVFTDSDYSIGKWYNLMIVPGIIILVIDVLHILSCRKKAQRREIVSFMVFTLFPVSLLPLEIFWETIPTYIGMTITCLLAYIMVHVEQERENVEMEKQLLQKEVELTESRTKLMMSQIQPHFMYNSLNSIYFLCEKDPELAQKAISDFSDYIRMNLDALTKTELVSFKSELKHINTYLWLEKLRFDDDLRIQYDIMADDFYIPVLSIQPLVENAVKHGICKKRNGGTVTISTEEFDHYYEIVVADDGVGFDVDNMIVDENRTHIGLENVKKRLTEIVGAKFELESHVGMGTTVTVFIPKTK